jgi:hypothetical protein
MCKANVIWHFPDRHHFCPFICPTLFQGLAPPSWRHGSFRCLSLSVIAFESGSNLSFLSIWSFQGVHHFHPSTLRRGFKAFPGVIKDFSLSPLDVERKSLETRNDEPDFVKRHGRGREQANDQTLFPFCVARPRSSLVPFSRSNHGATAREIDLIRWLSCSFNSLIRISRMRRIDRLGHTSVWKPEGMFFDTSPIGPISPKRTLEPRGAAHRDGPRTGESPLATGSLLVP